MLFFALGRALLNRVSRQTRLRKNPFILLTLEVSSEHIWTWIRGHFAYRTLKQIALTYPWLILGQCTIRNVRTTDQCLAITAFMYSCISVIWHTALEQTFKAAVKRDVELFLQNCRKTCWKAMLRFLTPPFKPVLKQLKVAACCASTDLLLDKITRESRHTRESRNLLQNKFALGR